MRRCSMAMLILSAGFIGFAAQAKPIRPETKSSDPLLTLDGVWRAVSVEHDGMPAPEDEIKGMEMKIAGKKLTIRTGRDEAKEKEAAVAVDFEKRPMELDIIPADGPEKGKKMGCVFQLDGGKLKLCAAKPGDPRPTEFKGGKDRAIIIFERAK